MKRLNKGKTIRIPESAITPLQELRETMERTSHFGGLRINHVATLNDGAVIAWAIGLTTLVMNPNLTVVDRRDLASKLAAALAPHLADLVSCTADEQKTRIGLLVAQLSVIGGYDATEPLRATTPEGNVT